MLMPMELVVVDFNAQTRLYCSAGRGGGGGDQWLLSASFIDCHDCTDVVIVEGTELGARKSNWCEQSNND